MLRFGYDFYSQDTGIEKSNGLIGQKITEKNKDVSNIFQLHLPPYLTEIFNRFDINFKIDSVDNIKNRNSKTKWVYVLDCIGDPRGWLGKYIPEYQNSIKSLFSGISKTSIDEVRKDKAVIMVYQPMEGYPTDWIGNNIFEVLYDEIIEYKLNPKNILYVTGNWKLESDFKKWKPKSKYSDLDDIVVYSFNNERFLDFRNKWDIADLESNKKRRKHFLCYNRTLRGHRLYLLASLHSKGLIEKGFVSCQKVQDNWLGGYLDGIGVGVNLRKQLVNYMREFQKTAPYIVDVDEWKTNHFDTSPVWPYEDSFFSVITSTLFNKKAIFLDEKVWKPILNYHPFIFVGCSGSLEELKRQGFKTFHPFIDETYDKQKHPVKRMMMITRQIEWLCGFTLDEMEKWYEELIPILEHNFKNLFNVKGVHDFVNFLGKSTSYV